MIIKKKKNLESEITRKKKTREVEAWFSCLLGHGAWNDALKVK